MANQHIEEGEVRVERLMAKLDERLKEREKPQVKAMLRKIFIEGKSAREALNLSEREMENMYAYAYNLFTHGKFKDARLMLEHLISLDPTNQKYALGCGAAFHQLKDYDMANGFYLLAHELDPSDPSPLYYMYDCFKNQGEQESAFMMLENVIAIAGERPEHAVLKERAIRTKNSMLQDITSRRQQSNKTS